METSFYSIMVKAHSGWRWVVLLLLLAAIGKMFMGMRGGKTYTKGDKKLAMFAMVAYHIQWLGGIILYFISPKVAFVEGFMKSSMLRFFAIEHITAMTIAFVLLTIGYSKSKKATEDKKKFKVTFTFYLIALIVILASIPWPFREALGVQNWF